MATHQFEARRPDDPDDVVLSASRPRELRIACGVGSADTVLLAGQLRKRLHGFAIRISSGPIETISGNADVVLAPALLAEEARAAAEGRPVVTFSRVIDDPEVASLIAELRSLPDRSASKSETLRGRR